MSNRWRSGSKGTNINHMRFKCLMVKDKDGRILSENWNDFQVQETDSLNIEIAEEDRGRAASVTLVGFRYGH